MKIQMEGLKVPPSKLHFTVGAYGRDKNAKKGYYPNSRYNPGDHMHEHCEQGYFWLLFRQLDFFEKRAEAGLHFFEEIKNARFQVFDILLTIYAAKPTVIRVKITAMAEPAAKFLP